MRSHFPSDDSIKKGLEVTIHNVYRKCARLNSRIINKYFSKGRPLNEYLGNLGSMFKMFPRGNKMSTPMLLKKYYDLTPS